MLIDQNDGGDGVFNKFARNKFTIHLTNDADFAKITFAYRF